MRIRKRYTSKAKRKGCYDIINNDKAQNHTKNFWIRISFLKEYITHSYKVATLQTFFNAKLSKLILHGKIKLSKNERVENFIISLSKQSEKPQVVKGVWGKGKNLLNIYK